MPKDYTIPRACTKCRDVKPPDQFSGKSSWCKRCRADAALVDYQRDPEPKKKAMRDRHTANAAEINAALRQARKDDPERFRAMDLARMGMTPERYAAIYTEQNGGCAICGQPCRIRKNLAIDHDHTCCAGKKDLCGQCTRGLLCSDCNNGLGRFLDNPDLLRAAADYLDEWKKRLRRNPASLLDEPVVSART